MTHKHPLLELQEATFSYPNSTTSKGKALTPQFKFSLSLEAGKIFAITGTSGAGKSTLFDLIAGFALPSSGTIKVDGQDIRSRHPAKRSVSILFQRDNLFSQLSALDNVCLALAPNGWPTAEQKELAHKALDRAGLGQVRDQRADELSGGQAQRVALVRETLRDTKLFLLDEPFNGLDEESRETMIKLVASMVTDKQRSVLIITHDLDAISSIISGHFVVENGSCKRVT